jgi:hypothetical protein
LSGRIDEAWVGYHPFAGPALDPERIKDGIAVMGEVVPDLRIAEADSVQEGDKVAFRWVVSGTHEGEFLGVAPTDAQIEAMGIDIVRVVDEEVLEYWGEFVVMSLLRQLGAIPLPGWTGNRPPWPCPPGNDRESAANKTTKFGGTPQTRTTLSIDSRAPSSSRCTRLLAAGSSARRW